MKIRLLFIIALLAVAPMFAQTYYAPSTLTNSCTAVTSAIGACTTLKLPGAAMAVGVTWQLSYNTGTASAISVTLEGSNDQSTWTTLDTNTACLSTGAAGCSRSVNVISYIFLRCNVGTYSVGTTNNLTCQLTTNLNGGNGSGNVSQCVMNSFGQWLATGTVIGCSPNLTESAGTLNYGGSVGIAAQSYTTLGTGAGQYTMQCGVAQITPTTGTVSFSAPSSCSQPFRMLLPSDIGSDNQVLYQVSHSGHDSVLGWTNAAASSPTFPVNAQTSTYQVLAADFTSCKTISVASGTFNVTLVASGSQPTSGQCIWVVNYGTGVVTIVRSGQDINGGTSSLTVPAGSATAPTGAWVVSDGTNYEATLFGASAGGGAPTFPVNAQTSTYQVLAADFLACKTISIASGTFTVTLVASGSQPSSGQCVWIVNYGSGTITIARSGQLINGGTGSLSLPGSSATHPNGAFIVSDGTNYETQLFGFAASGFSAIAPLVVTAGAGSQTLSLQNAASTNVTASLGTDTEIFTASGSAGTSGHIATFDAQGGLNDAGATMPAGNTINLLDPWQPTVCVMQGASNNTGVSLGGNTTPTNTPTAVGTVGSSTIPSACGAAFPIASAGTQYLEFSKTLEADFKSNSLGTITVDWYVDTDTNSAHTAIWDLYLGCGAQSASIQPTYGSKQTTASTTLTGTVNQHQQSTLSTPTFTCAAGKTAWARIYFDSSSTASGGNIVLLGGGLTIPEVRSHVTQ